MIGEPGEALTAIAPERAGQVATHGEIWNAHRPPSRSPRARASASPESIGLTLVVRKD